MIEAEVHLSLHNFLKKQVGFPSWHHHLTMARLVARALRVGRSALIQVGAACGFQGRYRTSFVASALMWKGPVIIVATEAVKQSLLKVEIPRLQEWLQIDKPIRIADSFPGSDFQGLLLISPQAWLKLQLENKDNLTAGVPTIIDGVDDLEDWVRQYLTITIEAQDWEELMLAYPNHSEKIRAARVELTKNFFQHPANPYECYGVTENDEEILSRLFSEFVPEHLPENWQKFFKIFQSSNQSVDSLLSNKKQNIPVSPLKWVTVSRRQGLFSLHCAPTELASILSPIWQRQPVVLIGSAIESETEAPVFQQQMGLSDLTCLKFSSDSQAEAISLYVPNRFPLPNTPQYQAEFINKVRSLLCLSATSSALVVILIGDVPLKSRAGAILASEFGSRVQVEKTCLEENGILISGWEYWQKNQKVLPTPELLIIATLPLPSLEHPLVALRVARYKQNHQDWFRLYLLPEALKELQRAIAPVRESKGLVALLDTRVTNRSYGAQVLSALSPMARINYLDPDLFASEDQNR
ncbi:MAG: helicase C-terminal domain-containing protein [Mastigocoleus sp.]|mgnify:CR=1 FL=1